MSVYNTAVHAEYPVLTLGNRSYPDGTYHVLCNGQRGHKVTVVHELRNAPKLLEWIKDKKAEFVTALSSRYSCYRQIERSFDSTQTINWSPDTIHELPSLHPMIIATSDLEHTWCKDSDSVHSLWDQETTNIPAGAKLAIGQSYRLQGQGFQSLLAIHLDEDMNAKQGQIKIVPNEEHGFQFHAHVTPELYELIHSHAVDHTRRHDIQIHIVSACLQWLRDRYWNQRPNSDDADEVAEKHSSLQAFAEEIQGRGLQVWSDPEFEPAAVATALYPHLPNTNIIVNDEEE